MTQETKTADMDRMIYTVTAAQRQAILSRSSRKEADLAVLDEMVKEMRSTFEKEGLVLIRGLLDDVHLQQLCDEGQAVADAVKMGTTFSSLKFSPIFSFPENSNGSNGRSNGTTNNGKNHSTTEDLSGQAFRDTALTSAIPAFIAKVLFQMEEEKEEEEAQKERVGNKNDNKDSGTTLRLLKDAFMAKGKEQKHCGWHVDDSGFWPTDASSNGVNVWIALDDMPAKYGGGLAVSPGSHTAEWRQKAYETIGSTMIFPPEGVEAGSELFKQVYGKTCSMATLDPSLNQLIESSKVEFDYQTGDCLFCTRWLFHRSVLINEEGLKQLKLKEESTAALKRYSIRYEKGTARIPKGLSVEYCVLMDENNSGQSLDSVCKEGTPFYPQCWPLLIPTDMQKQEQEMKLLATDTFPKLDAKRQEVLRDIMANIKPY